MFSFAFVRVFIFFYAPRARLPPSLICVYLLLVFPLQMQSGLDVSSCLLEGLSLGDLGRVVGPNPDHVSAQEDQHVGTDLNTRTHKQTNKHTSDDKEKT